MFLEVLSFVERFASLLRLVSFLVLPLFVVASLVIVLPVLVASLVVVVEVWLASLLISSVRFTLESILRFSSFLESALRLRLVNFDLLLRSSIFLFLFIIILNIVINFFIIFIFKIFIKIFVLFIIILL